MSTPKRVLRALDERDGRECVWHGESCGTDTLVPQHRQGGKSARPRLTHHLSKQGRAEMDYTHQCSLDACDRPRYARELCRMHYVRFMKHGDPAAVAAHSPVTFTVADRLAKRSRREGECLVFTGPRDRYGYGFLTVGNRKQGTHRLSYREHVGPIPDGMVVRHKCDNAPCMEPSHLELGSHAENQRDKVVRFRSTSGEKNPSAVLTAKTAVEIYRRLAAGETAASLAGEYGVGTSTIGRIRRRESWAREIDTCLGGAA